jgi:RNA polymerase sigma-70 factor, ECF subfamily
MPECLDEFETHRPQLSRLAYRMLGSLADAEDVLQEAYLRWSREPRTEVQSPGAFLNRIVTRLCIDRRRVIEARKETYIGPWLPEPIVEPADSARSVEKAEAVSMAMMVALESLSSVERAAYLLRRVFDYSYAEIASILEKSEPACRQLVTRAEQHLRQRRPRYDVDWAEAKRVTGAFVEACASGNVAGFVRILTEDVVAYSDGGGKVAAALAPVSGADRVSRFFAGLIKKAPAGMELRHAIVNGAPGLVVLAAGSVDSLLTFEIAGGRIAACFIIRNPDKVRRAALSLGVGPT